MILVPNANSPWDKIKKLVGMSTWMDQQGTYKQYSVDELRQYGKVTGEIRFFPLESLFRSFPRLGHSLMLEIVNE